MSFFLKRFLVILVYLGLLNACSGGSDISGSTPDTTFVVTQMSIVKTGFQTFQQRDLAYDGIVPSVNDSRYVYKNRDSEGTDNSKAITFISVNGSETKSEDLVVSAITDINDLYSSLSMKNVTIKVNGTNYTGDYVLIQEKSTGNLYPVLDGDAPLLRKELNEDVFWYNLHRFSNIADQERLYINNSVTDELSIAELSNGLFTITATFDYKNYDFWIDDKGDILSQSWADRDSMTWLDRSTSESVHGNFLTSQLPFLYNGGFYAKKTTDNKVYNLIRTTTSVSAILDATWKIVAPSYIPASSSAKRNNYEMSVSCSLYQFDVSDILNKEIKYISDFNAVNGQFAIAGQNSLFCVHATTANNTAFPIITKVNTTTLSFHTFSTSEGSMLDASNRLTVISDDQVMFSEMATDSFYEYYIDVVNRAEEAMVVTEASIVGLQTLD